MSVQATSRAPLKESNQEQSLSPRPDGATVAMWFETWRQVIVAELLHLLERRREN